MYRIKEAREARGWTQEQLANAIGTTQQTIQRWESGIVVPKVTRVLEISQALGITVSFLLDKSELPPEFPLTPDEIELVEAFRSMDLLERHKMLEIAHVLSGR